MPRKAISRPYGPWPARFAAPSSPPWREVAAGDIERAGRALEGAARPRIHTFLATSDIHLQHKLKISRRQCLEQARDGVKLARTFCKDVQFSAEDASRTDINFLCEVLEAVIEAGATTLNIPDTVGFSVPTNSPN